MRNKFFMRTNQKGEYWIIPSIVSKEIVKELDLLCNGNRKKYLSILQHFIKGDFRKYVDGRIIESFQQEDWRDNTKLLRALNINQKYGVYIRSNNTGYLDMLCFFAFQQSWEKTLSMFNLTTSDIAKRNKYTSDNQYYDSIFNQSDNLDDYILKLNKKSEFYINDMFRIHFEGFSNMLFEEKLLIYGDFTVNIINLTSSDRYVDFTLDIFGIDAKSGKYLGLQEVYIPDVMLKPLKPYKRKITFATSHNRSKKNTVGYEINASIIEFEIDDSSGYKYRNTNSSMYLVYEYNSFISKK